MCIVIVDYGAGNVYSIKNMLTKLGHESLITNSINEICNASKIILPGVGNFEFGMHQLEKFNLIEVLNARILVDKIPILGICLGAQLMCNHSEEGDVFGLGWLPAKVMRFNFVDFKESRLKIPHMGWNDILIEKESCLFSNIFAEYRFYFVHGYHFVVDNNDVSLTKTFYGYEFSSSLNLDNIYAVQFHPEKSHKYGLELMSNFVKL